MMNKYRAIVLMVVFHAVGIGLGGGLMYWFNQWTADKFISMSATAEAGVKMRAASQIRKGNTNDAIETLETTLDGDLITLETTVGRQSPHDRDPMIVKTLGRIRDYRAKFPHTSSVPEIDLSVSNALRIPDQ